MSFKNCKLLFCIMLACYSSSLLFGETVKLGQQGQWNSDGGSGKADLATEISEFKQMINSSQKSKAFKKAEQLKRDWPQLQSGDFDAFVACELLYAKKSHLKAARAYKDFTEKYPQSVFFDAAIERIYDLSVLFINGQKVTRLWVLRLRAYEEADALMRYIAERTGDAPIAQRALITLAQGYEKRGEYLEGYQVWSDIIDKWPTGKLGQESLLGMSRSLHSSYRGPKYASQNLENAESYYKDLELRYPETAEELDIKSQIKLIEEQKAFKEYSISRYYETIGDKEAAGLYYQSVIDEWSNSAAGQLAKKDYRKMLTTVEKKKRRGPVEWWFYPENEEKMFFFKLPD